MKRLRFIVVAGVVAVFAVVSMVSQGHAHTGASCSDSSFGTWDKTVTLTVAAGKWTILKHDEKNSNKAVVVDALMYNGSVPGPTIEANEGQQVCVEITNKLTSKPYNSDTALHFHGIGFPYVENNNDGVPTVNAGPMIMPGEILAVHFTAPPAGGYVYHAHEDSVRQAMLGLYGRIIVHSTGWTPGDKDKDADGNPYAKDEFWMLSEWHVTKDQANNVVRNIPAGLDGDNLPNYFTINGKAFDPVALGDPDAGASVGNKLVVLKQGEKARIRLFGMGQWPHAMHMHGRNFKVIAKDSTPLTTPQTMNTVTVHPGELYDIEFEAETGAGNNGIWVFHCHLLDHATNNDSYPGGMISAVVITNP